MSIGFAGRAQFVIWLSVAAGYLVGALPFGFWLVRWQREGADLRQLGSGNPGATNALRVGGTGIGLLTLFLDVLKGVLAVELARALGVEPQLLGAAALAAVVGHVAPVWLRFKGGKGVATAAGGLVVLAPLALAGAAVVFLLAVLATRIVALGSIAAAVALPLGQWWTTGLQHSEDGWMILWIMVISLIVVVRHKDNLRRLRQGREARLGNGLGDS